MLLCDSLFYSQCQWWIKQKRFLFFKKACIGHDKTEPTGKIAISQGYGFTENSKNILRVTDFKHGCYHRSATPLSVNKNVGKYIWLYLPKAFKGSKLSDKAGRPLTTQWSEKSVWCRLLLFQN
jgi:hypothetical protein